ncbi:MAG: transposase [Acidobacteriota bacterium]
MARQLRIEFPDALYHVTSRGNEQRDIFRDDFDRSKFLAILGEAVERFGWSITAWVLMTNHFHLVIQTPDPNLSRGMQWVNGTYASWFNRQHKRCGHLFQGRFKSFLVEKETYFRRVLRYVVLNPVRAGLVALPEHYRWSSYRATSGLEPAEHWFDVHSARALFESDPELAPLTYQAFVAAEVGDPDRLWKDVINCNYLGSPAWAKKMREMVESRPRSSDHPRAQRAIGRPTMQEIVKTVARVANVSRDEIRTRRGSPIRRLIAWLGWHEGLVTLRSIAASILIRSEGHVSGMIRRCEREFSSDPVLLEQLDLVTAALRR